MPYSHASLEAGLTTFGELLEAEYGEAIGYWTSLKEWGDAERLQIFRALMVLILVPIADPAPADALAASDLGAKRNWLPSDHKLAGVDFENTWQWRLLAAIDNATKSDGGPMMTPSDPRLFILKLRYRHDFFAALGEHFAAFFCGGALIPHIEVNPTKTPGALLPEACVGQAGVLQQIAGLETASPAFIAGLLFILTQLGTKSFCDWALEGR